MQGFERRWLPILLALLVILAALLVALSSLALLFVIISILGRFSQPILLFVLGALLAYLLAPLVNGLQKVVRKRWLAIPLVYLGVILALLGLGALLFTPFVNQAQSLVENLRNPSQGSLVAMQKVRADATLVSNEVTSQQQHVSTINSSEIKGTTNRIARLQKEVVDLSQAKTSSKVTPETQTRIPPSYVQPISVSVTRLATSYKSATKNAAAVNPQQLANAATDARQAYDQVSSTQKTVASTPVLVLGLQGWLDDRGIKVDLQQNLGKGIQQLNNQAAGLLNSAVTILLSVGNLLLNGVLILIISIYFLADGPRLIRTGIQRFPVNQQDEAKFFVTSLDRVMGGYLRGQIVLAGLSGLLGGLGAWVLGVPYAVLIGVSTFILQLVPVIGAVVLIVPPVIIGLIFTPLPKPIIILVYFLVMEQIVTNIIGPRVMSTAVGIHPLEAMAAALIGFPVAGFLGSFFAVPVVGFFHILVKEAIRQYRDPGPTLAGDAVDESPVQPVPGPATSPGG